MFKEIFSYAYNVFRVAFFRCLTYRFIRSTSNRKPLRNKGFMV